MASTPAGRSNVVLSPGTRLSGTAAGSQSSIGCHHTLRWRPFISFGQKLLASRWQQGSSDGTSSDVTSPPNDTLSVESVVAALKERLRGAEMLVAGDLNVKISGLEGDRRGEEVMAALTTERLEDMLYHIFLRRLPW